MKKILITFLTLFFSCTVQAADLLEVYQQAQCSDPVFQQAVAQRLSTKEGVPISLASLLPNLLLNFNPTVTRQGFAGSSLLTDIAGNTISPRNNTQRAYNLSLSLNQTIFDYAQYANLQGSLATSNAADATLNAALQELMIRVSKAYFAILENEDKLRYSEASKITYKEQLSEAKQNYDVGLKTITDVYTAQARYDSAVADYVAKEADLANSRENLRAITGKYYPDISKLSESFPLLVPAPANIDAWTQTALRQNWNIKSAQYNVSSKLQTVHQEFAGHLPTAQLQGSLSRNYQDNINGYESFNQRNGPAEQVAKTVGVNINFPIFSGGGVVAQTNQATYNYQVTQQQLEQATRDTVNSTRQSYLNVLSYISQIKADRQAIKSNISSLEGMEASYKVGTETLVNVLNQQEKLFQSQTEYATDRYAFVNNLLSLKQAAGTLSFDDLHAINRWLTESIDTTSIYHRKPIKQYSMACKKSPFKTRTPQGNRHHRHHHRSS